jgi:hypothetical protein
MIHNPHWNKYPVGGRPWTPEEDRTALSMIDNGFTYQAIGECINRTVPAIKGHIRYLRLTPEQRAEENGTRNWELRNTTSVKITIPESVIEDRNRRLMAARDLTGVLMGDPAPQYSALYHRTREAASAPIWEAETVVA